MQSVVVQFQFPDRMVTYDQFVNDVAARLSCHLNLRAGDPRYMSQAAAFREFGRANVERWRRTEKVQPCQRPGKLEYETARLRELQAQEQDYL